MSFDMKQNMSRVFYTLIMGFSITISALAEPDVLDRPAIMRSSERTTTSVLLALEKAGKRLVAVGERGLILWSDDDGKSWQQAKVPVSVTLTSISFVNDKEGWVTGHSGIVLQTKDGGLSWNKLLDGKRAAELVLEEAKKSNASKAFVADAQRLLSDGPDKPFLDVHFFDSNNGLIVGAYGLIFSTTNGGITWKPLQEKIDNPKGLHIYSIHDAGDAIYLAGEQGSIFVSKNNEDAYKVINTPYQGTYFGVLAAGENLIAFGMRGNAYWSSDKGLSWQKCDSPVTNTLTAGVRMSDGHVVLVDDGGNVLISKDSGKHFTKSELPKVTPLSAAIETTNGQLLFAGVRGINKASQNQTDLDNKK
ncbi:WD40/YVTN/BNR-like repeat-containing protein [Ampullimonas aquatilis]|uniref:WD40/YVTN/BNR-like repeat-containing protein n=1 Tax=Ampullimonas aquatilis TaxID=1341549 RepID=UPI003C71B9FF